MLLGWTSADKYLSRGSVQSQNLSRIQTTALFSIHALLKPSHEGLLPYPNVGHPLAPALRFSKAPTTTGSAPTSLDLQGTEEVLTLSPNLHASPLNLVHRREFIASRVTAAKKFLSKGISSCSSGAAITYAIICSVVLEALAPKAFSGPRIEASTFHTGSSTTYCSHVTLSLGPCYQP